MLGRWSPKWQIAQKKYLTSIKSKKSSLRWAALIIHKLLMTVWNVWDFRNNINKGKNDPKYVRKQRELCKTINDEHTKGTNSLLKLVHHLTYSYYQKYCSQWNRVNNGTGYIQFNKHVKTSKIGWFGCQSFSIRETFYFIGYCQRQLTP